MLYLEAAVLLFGTHVEFAVQEDFTRTPGELKHVKGEVVGGSQSVVLHLHRLVSRVGTAAHRQENTLCSGVHERDQNHMTL